MNKDIKTIKQRHVKYGWPYIPWSYLEDDLDELLDLGQEFFSDILDDYVFGSENITEETLTLLREDCRTLTEAAHDRHDRELEHILSQLKGKIDRIQKNYECKRQLSLRDPEFYAFACQKADKTLDHEVKKTVTFLVVIRALYEAQDVIRQAALATLEDTGFAKV